MKTIFEPCYTKSELKKLRTVARKVEKAHQFTVAANLAYHWYDEIEAGRKKTEYRDISPYWTNHLFKDGDIYGQRASFIKFSRDYTRQNMTWAVRRIDISEEEGCYMIRLGRRIS